MKLTIIQVPYDSGHYNQRMGAGPIRLTDPVRSALQVAHHDVQVAEIRLNSEFTTEAGSAFELAAAIRDNVRAAIANGSFPIVLAGNCIASAGAVAGSASSSVVWFDAHGDLNTPETTASGFLDGMAVSVLLGRCWRGMSASIGLNPVEESDVWLIGARDLDPAEAEYLARSEVHRITTDAIRTGATPASHGDVYVHLDLDVLDPRVGTANCFATPEGLLVEQVLVALDATAASGRVTSAAFTAYDPAYDADAKVLHATIRIAEHLARIGSVAG